MFLADDLHFFNDKMHFLYETLVFAHLKKTISSHVAFARKEIYFGMLDIASTVISSVPREGNEICFGILDLILIIIVRKNLIGLHLPIFQTVLQTAGI